MALLLVLGATVGCAETAGENSEPTVAAGVEIRSATTGKLAVPVAKLDFPNGSHVEFLAEDRGDLKVIEWGPNGSKPVIDKQLQAEGLSPVDLYARLSGNPAPAALIDSQALQESMAASAFAQAASQSKMADTAQLESSQTTSVAGSGTSDVAVASQPLIYFDCIDINSTDEWFNCTYCPNYGTNDFTGMWSTGSTGYQFNDVIWAEAAIAVIAGDSVHFKYQTRAWWSWSTPLDVNVPNGYYISASSPASVWADFDQRSSVDKADGDVYHLCAHGTPW